MLSLEGAVTCAVVRNPLACVLLRLSLVKFQQEWSQGVHSGAVSCGESGKKTMPRTRCQKLPQRPSCVKTVVRQNPVWRQFIISQTMHCHGNSAMWPPCYLPWILPVHSGRHVGQVRRSCTKHVFAGKLMLCLVFVGECIGKVINFKWLSKNINADASNLIGKAKFFVAVT